MRSVCDLFQAASRRSNSIFAAELNSKNAPAVADLILHRMDKLMRQHHGLVLPDQAPTPGKKLKKGSSAESSPGSLSEPRGSNEKSVNIVEDLARCFALRVSMHATCSTTGTSIDCRIPVVACKSAATSVLMWSLFMSYIAEEEGCPAWNLA